MKRGILTALIISIGILSASCQNLGPNELSKSSSTAGLNGGFEMTDSGYPVNWAFGPNPETSGAFEVSVDSVHVVEGKNALKLVTRQSDRTIGVRSRRMPVQSGKDYRISMWIKNEGCSVKVNRITQDSWGTTEIRSDIIVNSSASSDQWQQFEETLSISDNEAKVFLIFLIDGSCTFWCDDVRIEEVVE